MTAYHLSRPERHCVRAQSRRVREVVLAAGGCRYCVHRSSLFAAVGDLAACGLTPARAFPACIAFAGGFDFDEAEFRARTGKPSAQGNP